MKLRPTICALAMVCAALPLSAHADSVYINQAAGNVLSAPSDGLSLSGLVSRSLLASSGYGLASSFSSSSFLHPPSVGSLAEAYQYGSNNTANLDVHSGNAAHAEQYGADNTTSINAGGSGNSVGSLQIGNGNASNLATAGSGNTLLQGQIGNYNSSNISLANTGTTLVQVQIGNGLSFNLSQYSSQFGQLSDNQTVIIVQRRNY